jgi:hypothetical protein
MLDGTVGPRRASARVRRRIDGRRDVGASNSALVCAGDAVERRAELALRDVGGDRLDRRPQLGE